ncbi:MAG: efflux RND transporter permease subunit [Betaproteobacteria bacterium]|nr:efflux RND transporter permease subunit [Betaproteobacteria bacterium]
MPGGGVASQHRHHPVAAAGLLVVVALAGVFAFVHLQPGVPPHLDYPAAQVSIRDPGVPASVMDRRVALPLFHYLSQLHDLHDVRSASTEGSTRIILAFRHAVGLSRSLSELHALIARTLPLPASAGRPAVVRVHALDAVAGQIWVTAPKWPLAKLRRWAEVQLMPQFLGLAGVAGARVAGGPVREIRVVPEQRRLAQLGLALDDVVAAVRVAEAQSPSGYLVAGTRSGSATIAALPVRLPNGDILSLSQVAAVRGDSRPGGPDVRLNGRPAVLLVLMRAHGVDPIAVANAIKAHADWLRANGLIPAGVQVRVESALAQSLTGMLRRFYVMAAVALVLILAVALWPVTGVRTDSSGFMVALAALLASGVFLLSAGMTLNLMDLCGLVAAAGMGLAAPLAMRRPAPAPPSLQDTARCGASRALGVILPTVILLLVLLVVPGPLGRLFRDLIAVVLAVLCLSWVLAVAVRSAGSGSVDRPAIRRRSVPRRYRAWIAGGAGRPARSLAVAGLAVAGLFYAAALLLRGTVFFPPPETADVQVRISATGAPGARSLAAESLHIAQLAHEQGGVAQVVSVMRASPAVSMRLRVVLAGHPRALSAEKWISRFEQVVTHSGLANVQVRSTLVAFPGIRPGYHDAPLLRALDGMIGIEVTGPGGAALARVGEGMARILRGQPTVRDVCISSAGVASDLVLHINPMRAAERGVNEEQVTRALRIARGGLVAGTVLEGERRRDIRIALAPQAGRVAELPKLLLRGETRTRRAVYLGDVASVGHVPEVAQFRRKQGRPVVAVSGVLDANGFDSDAVRMVERRISRFRLPPGYRLSLTGIAAVTESASGELSALALIALPILAAVLAWRYRGWRRPLIVLLSAPYAVAGALVALGFGEHVLSAPGWVGLILSTGVAAGLAVLTVDVMDWSLLGRRRGRSLAAAASPARSTVLRLGAGASAGAILLVAVGAPEFALLRPLAMALLGGLSAGIAASLLWTQVLYGILLGSHGALPAGKSGGQAPE